MRPTGSEEFVYQAVLTGELEIRPDGSIWRLAQQRRNRWNTTVTITPVVPHRVDTLVPDGYRIVKIMRCRRQVSTPAHRLVWRHCRGEIPEELTINHKNGVRSDNHPENLELATPSDQLIHSVHVLRTARAANQRGEKNHAAKLTVEQVTEIRIRRSQGKPLARIAAAFGVGYKAISKIVHRRRWSHVA